MSVQDLLTGTGQLSEAFYRRKKMQQLEEEAEKERQLKVDLQESSQKFTSEEAGKQREFQAKESTKALAPTWSKIRMAQDKIERETNAAKKAMEDISGSVEGQTLKGQLLTRGLEGGTLSPVEAGKNLPAGPELYLGIAKKAFTEKDPVLKEAYNQLADSLQMINEDAAYREGVAREAAKSAGGKTVKTKFQPDSIMPAVEEQIKKYFPDFDFEGEEKLADEIIDKSKEDITFSWPDVRREMEDNIALKVMQSDNRFRENAVAAHKVVSDIFEKIYTGGKANLMKPKIREDTGEAVYGEYYGYYPIELDMRRSSIFEVSSGAGTLFGKGSKGEVSAKDFSIKNGKLEYKKQSIADYIINGPDKE